MLNISNNSINAYVDRNAHSALHSVESISSGQVLKRLLVGSVFALIVIMLCTYQQYLMRKYGDKKGFKAFLNNHWVGLVIFVGILFGHV